MCTIQKCLSIPGHGQNQFFQILPFIGSWKLWDVSFVHLNRLCCDYDFWWEWNRCFEFENRIWYVYTRTQTAILIWKLFEIPKNFSKLISFISYIIFSSRILKFSVDQFFTLMVTWGSNNYFVTSSVSFVWLLSDCCLIVVWVWYQCSKTI